MTEPLLIIISGASGTGKGTICNELRRRQPDIVNSISCTTRAMRPGDREGVTYFFKTPEEFAMMREADLFLESAAFYGNCYGTPRAFVEETLKSGRDCLLEIDPQGAEQIMAKCPGAVSIYLMPPSMKELLRRLTDRGTEDAEKLAVRYAASREEMSHMPKYRYCVVNDQVAGCVDVIEAILLAERHATHRNLHLLEMLKGEIR
jgi:guanylate kinase